MTTSFGRVAGAGVIRSLPLQAFPSPLRGHGASLPCSLAGAFGESPTHRRTNRLVPGRCGCVPRCPIGLPRAFWPLLHGQPGGSPCLARPLLEAGSRAVAGAGSSAFARGLARSPRGGSGSARRSSRPGVGAPAMPWPLAGLPATRRPGGLRVGRRQARATCLLVDGPSRCRGRPVLRGLNRVSAPR